MIDVTVIVAAYNAESTIKNCLASLAQQTFDKPIQIIVVDDGSADNTLSILKDAQSNQKMDIYSQKHAGVSTARNLALSKSQGKFICFVDADDTIEPDFIKILYDLNIQNQTDISACNVNYVYKNYIQRPLKVQSRTLTDNEYLSSLLYEIKGFVANKMFSKEFIGQATFTPQISICEDFLFNIDIANKHPKVSVTNQPLYNYTQNHDSATNTAYSSQKIDEIKALERIITKISDPIVKKPYLIESLQIAYKHRNSINKFKNRGLAQEKAYLESFISKTKQELQNYYDSDYKIAFKLSLYKNFYPAISCLKNLKHSIRRIV